MAVSKVELANGEVLMDLTGDSVTPETLAEGATAHAANGEQIVGTMKGGAGTSVQSDWNQTDSSAADFIKNKPFGDAEGVLVEKQTFTSILEGSPLLSNGLPSVGDAATVVYDGITYELEVKDCMGMPAVGNGSLLDMYDTGEPFFVIWLDTTTAMVVTTDVSIEHTISVDCIFTTKIPEKYSNDPVAKFYISQKGSSTETKYLCKQINEITKVTQEELIATVGKKPIVLSLGDGVFFTPLRVDPYGGDNNEYGVIYILLGDSIIAVYTAEYTPTTT